MKISDLNLFPVSQFDARLATAPLTNARRTVLAEPGDALSRIARYADRIDATMIVALDERGAPHGVLDLDVLKDHLSAQVGLRFESFEDAFRSIEEMRPYLPALQPQLQYCTTHKWFCKAPVPCRTK